MPILTKFIITCCGYKSHDERDVWVCVWESRSVSRTRPLARFNREGIPGGTFDLLTTVILGAIAAVCTTCFSTTNFLDLKTRTRERACAVLIIAGNAGHWCFIIVVRIFEVCNHKRRSFCDLLQYSLSYGDSSSQNCRKSYARMSLNQRVERSSGN